jgi:ubiquinone/menaquinone biosynthesis C-methylase UbiE
MSLYGRIFPALYDHMMKKVERDTMHAHRRALLADARGDVLEIGGGTGANLEFYGEGVRSLTITEPEQPMIKRLEPRIAERAPHARFLRAPAEDLPFEDASFDVAVSTLVLCTVDDQPRALRELRRVVRPGGRLVFVEHVRADDPKLARLQDRMHRLNVRVGHGCHCNRPTLDTIRSAGFEVTQLHRDTIPYGPPWIRPLIVGVAQRSAGEVAATEPLSASHVA